MIESDNPNAGQLLTRLLAATAASRADLDSRIFTARELMEARAGDELDVQTLAKAAALSPYHFIRRFRQIYGVTPHQFLTELRIERAQALLRETDLSVTDVCLEVGFSSLGSFSSLFRRRVGHAPGHYRRRFVQSIWEPPRIPCCFLKHFGRA